MGVMGKARQGVNLAPAERAVVKFIKTFGFGVASLALVNLGPVSQWVHSVGLPPSVADAAMALVTAALMAWDKYNTAQRDAPIQESAL